MDGLIAYTILKKYVQKLVNDKSIDGFEMRVESDRSILNGVGESKILYLLPKVISKPQDGYDEYVYTNNSWEQVGSTDIDMSSYATKIEVGDLTSLATQNKSSLVAAINEIASIPNADTMSFPLGSEVSDG